MRRILGNVQRLPCVLWGGGPLPAAKQEGTSHILKRKFATDQVTRIPLIAP